MYFFATGKAAPPVHFDSKRQEARFTLRDKNNRFYVVTTCVEQYEMLLTNPDQEILVIGTVFSFQERGARSHRVGFRPMLLLPLNGDIDQAEQITIQLVKFSLRGAKGLTAQMF
jgi:hypothetical protein